MAILELVDADPGPRRALPTARDLLGCALSPGFSTVDPSSTEGRRRGPPQMNPDGIRDGPWESDHSYTRPIRKIVMIEPSRCVRKDAWYHCVYSLRS